MLNNPNIAVLLTAYNGENWLNEQIESILRQEAVNVKIYIGLDFSSDASKEVIQKLALQNDNIVLLREGKFGSAGKNFYGLIKDSRIPIDFDYYCLADQDDIWLETKLISAINTLQEQGAHGYSSNVTAFWPDGREKLIVKSQPQKQWDYLFEAAGPGCTYVLSAQLFQQVSSYFQGLEQPVERFEAHDWMIYAFARSRNYAWVIDSRSFMRYRQHANNQVGANKGLKAYIKRLDTVLSGTWFSKVEVLIDILKLQQNRPAKLMMQKKTSAYFKLVAMSFEFRRKSLEQLYLAAFFIIFSIKNIFVK